MIFTKYINEEHAYKILYQQMCPLLISMIVSENTKIYQ